MLEAIVDGFPSPDIKITKNGEELFENGNTTISNKCNKIIVQLQNVNVQDAGRYSVVATNAAGSSTSTADVVVKSKLSENVLCLKIFKSFINVFIRIDFSSCVWAPTSSTSGKA